MNPIPKRVTSLAGFLLACGFLAAVVAQSNGAAAGSPPTVPLAVGLTIVTAVNEKQGDYESIKQVEAIGGGLVRIKYSSDRPLPLFGFPIGRVKHVTVTRTVLLSDLLTAAKYLQWFTENLPERVPGTTAIGVSADVIRRLRSTGQSNLTCYLVPPPGFKLEQLPRYALEGTVRRVESAPVPVQVLVNDHLVSLPGIHVKGVLGKSSQEQTEFFFLDDPANPLTLRFAIGKDRLHVVKISVPEGAGAQPSFGIARALAARGRANVYGIYFDFGQATIKDASEPVLREIGSALAKNPTWRLSIEGHTDNIGGEAYNLDLSTRRAAAVKDALVSRFHIAGERLTTVGFGASRPKATNDTLEGRAANRRVELVRR